MTPVDSEHARRLRQCTERIGRWTDERDRVIVDAVRCGASLREVATHAGISHTWVKKIVDDVETS